MRIYSWIIIAALTLSAALARPVQADPLELRGEIQRGETLVHSFEHNGRRFELRLLPVGYGWSVWIGDPMNRDRNYVIGATPPYRGINPAVIQGWHFRNADNTGPNKPGESHVNAPGRIRTFAFVLDSAGYHAAQESLEILLWPEGHDKVDIDSAQAELQAVPRAPATMEIEALELGNLVKGKQAWIERMAFRLRLNLP